MLLLERDAVHVWEPEHVRAFLGRCAGHRLGALYEFVVLTGLRRGEIAGLRWQDADLATRKVVVRHNRVTANGRVQEQTTKTQAGLRTVPLSDFAVATLLAWQLRQAEEAATAVDAWVARVTCSPLRMAGHSIRRTSRDCFRR